MPRQRSQHLLITTKMNRPQLPAGLIVRPRLLERLDEALGRRVTLISAPAGYGKTTLAVQWLERCPSKIAWISLDPDRFSGYKAFFRHAGKPMGIMADLLCRGRNADEIMKVRRMEEKVGERVTAH